MVTCSFISASHLGNNSSATITCVSKAARVHSSKVHDAFVERIRRETRPRALSPSWTMYLGKFFGSGLPSLVNRKGVVLQFCIQPVRGFVNCGNSSMV